MDKKNDWPTHKGQTACLKYDIKAILLAQLALQFQLYRDMKQELLSV